MSLESPRAKQDEILKFLDERAGDDRLLTFEKNRLISRFTDDTYDEEMVEELINELVSDGVLKKDSTKLEVIYPSAREETLKERFGSFVEVRSIFSIFLWGTALYLLLLNWYPLGGTNPFFRCTFWRYHWASGGDG